MHTKRVLRDSLFYIRVMDLYCGVMFPVAFAMVQGYIKVYRKQNCMKKRVEKKLTRYERAAVLHYVMALVFFVTVFMQVVSLSFRAAILPLILGAASLVIGTIYLYCDKKKC